MPHCAASPSERGTQDVTAPSQADTQQLVLITPNYAAASPTKSPQDGGKDKTQARFTGDTKAGITKVGEDERHPCGCKEGRNLVVCIDGTSNQFGMKVRISEFLLLAPLNSLSEKNSNVVEFYSLLEKDKDQRTWYDSGIGTYAKSSWKSRTGGFFSRIIDTAFAPCVFS